MSRLFNKNGKIATSTEDRRTYKIITSVDQDPYPIEWECWIQYKRKSRWTGLFTFQYRQYRSWKYNRKTQWKERE